MFDGRQQERLFKAQTMCKSMITKHAAPNKWSPSGITIQFSSGDDGDNFPIIGLSSANYPSESPYVTAVGGTSLQIGSKGRPFDFVHFRQ